MMIALRPRQDTVERSLPHAALAHRKHGVGHRDVDDLSLAGPPRMVDRRQHAEAQHHARDDVAHPGPTFVGVAASGPVIAMMPPIACATTSNAGQS